MEPNADVMSSYDRTNISLLPIRLLVLVPKSVVGVGEMEGGVNEGNPLRIFQSSLVSTSYYAA